MEKVVMLLPSRRVFVATLLSLVLFAVRVAAGYVAPTAVDVAALLPAPPALNSVEGKIELDQVVYLHQNATQAVLTKGAEENEFTVFHFAPVLGEWLSVERLPKTAAFFKILDADSRAITTIGKTRWKRQRPCAVGGTRIQRPIEPEDKGSLSYPSGHATRGLLFALVLAEVIPTQREALLQKGRETGYLRVQGGMHYPSDVFAGRVLAMAIFAELKKNPLFTKDLAAVAAEMAAAQE